MQTTRAIGLRVYANRQVFYTIIESDDVGNLVYRDISYINVPLSLDIPERLNFIRNTILDVILEYDIKLAGIRVSEMTRTFNQTAIERFNLEGVIQECLASSGVVSYIAGRIGQISALAKIPQANFKKLAAGEMVFEFFKSDRGWDKLSLEERESSITCFAALQLN